MYALDNTKTCALSREERLAIARLKLDRMGGLPNKVDLVIGMKAIIIQNMAMNAGLANSSRGIITDIILAPGELIEDKNAQPMILTYCHHSWKNRW